MLNLAHDLTIVDLYRQSGLEKLDGIFLARLAQIDDALHARLMATRINSEAIPKADASALILELAPCLENFLIELFGIADEARFLAQQHADLTPLYEVKRQFVQRQAAKLIQPEQAAAIDGEALHHLLAEQMGGQLEELSFARKIIEWQSDKTTHGEILEVARQYAAWAVHTEAGRHKHHRGILFKVPVRVDSLNLVLAAQKSEQDGVVSFRIAPEHIRRRNGFALTDQGTDLRGALDQSNYCVLCHTQKKDSCSNGLREKAVAGSPVSFKKSPFGISLAGCPLEEKISEFHTLKNLGHAIGALAVITIDNPMVAATGHRICNDCMKSCIYQKQEPVNIPEVETRTLKDVLELPWGFEIYSLLTRWNPLNLRRPLPRRQTGRKVLVAGMGPAGFTLAHYLMNDGHAVVGIDGLKIEPLPENLSGVRMDGVRTSFEAIRDITNLYEPLEERAMAGFGGVAEYGITVRWNKNFLKLIRLLLVRRSEFALFGGVRFGGTLTVDDALARGFDHVALCLGAGKPTVLDIPNGLARGVRTASDFLMALQLTGAAKKNSIANMQLRLPVIVIGGGLTAIDTATEALAYYAVQVEKFLQRYEALIARHGEALIRAGWDAAEQETAEEFLSHARALRKEHLEAQQQGRVARVVELLQEWGGATVAYRRRMIDSPAYTLNHEEIEKALEEGVCFAECLTPLAVEVDQYAAACGISFARQVMGEDGKWASAGTRRLPARTIFVAAGTQPNTVLAREDELHFKLDGKFFSACDESGLPVKPARAQCKPERVDVLLSRLADGRFISFFGDLHPSYSGNVVKAMASAKQGYPVISRVLEQRPAQSAVSSTQFFNELCGDLNVTVHHVERLTPNIVEVVMKAPMAARNFQPGQFYRLQNFEANALQAAGTRLQMEGVALTGAWVDRQQGLVSTVVLEMGGSANLCAALRPGEPVVLMGPTGAPTHIEANETVILCGGGLGNAVLFSIGQAFRAKKSKVLYFAGYKKIIDRYKVQEIEAAADIVVWCCDEGPGFVPDRPQDRTFVGNIVEAMAAYATGRLGDQPLRMLDADRLIAIGSDRMMAGVAKARHGVLQPYLKPHHFAIGSVNSPMQCMMKEICAQCLQQHRDPQSGELSYVFSCFNQDQPLDCVDFDSLNQRLKQNSLQEKLSKLWLEHCLRDLPQLHTQD
ncbi:MAG: FAD-dependent oxidoreductase [Betaproteobacteria bacterium]|nr:FAD-dependent oxidoreductase [Betaproteobacteria bacterium]